LPARELRTEGGPAWGRVVTARAGSETEPRPWYCPPRPLEDAHIVALGDSIARARDASQRGERTTALARLAAFHQRFVRLHPFRAGNQSLAMNLVNAVLGELHGVGIPHLVLDQLALRFGEAAYARLFARAVNGWTAAGSPLERYRALTERKARYFSLLAALDRTTTLDEARALVRARPDDATLALLRA
jgi:hypothetical protein